MCIALVASVAAVAGCGGGGDDGTAGGTTASADTTAPSHPIAKAAFIKRANAICTEGKSRTLEEMTAYVKAQGAESLQDNPELLTEALTEVFLPAVGKQIEEIRALGTPKGDPQQVEAFLAALQEAVDSGEGSSLSGVELAKSFKRSVKLANESGLSACAYG